jgi:hypothetical protein
MKALSEKIKEDIYRRAKLLIRGKNFQIKVVKDRYVLCWNSLDNNDKETYFVPISRVWL